MVALSSCGPRGSEFKTKFRNTEACVNLGIAGAQCAHTYTQETRTLTKEEFEAESIGWVSIRAEDFSDREDAIDEICRATEKCDFEMQEIIEKHKEAMKPLLKAAKKALKRHNKED